MFKRSITAGPSKHQPSTDALNAGHDTLQSAMNKGIMDSGPVGAKTGRTQNVAADQAHNVGGNTGFQGINGVKSGGSN